MEWNANYDLQIRNYKNNRFIEFNNHLIHFSHITVSTVCSIYYVTSTAKIPTYCQKFWLHIWNQCNYVMCYKNYINKRHFGAACYLIKWTHVSRILNGLYLRISYIFVLVALLFSLIWNNIVILVMIIEK